MELELYKYPWKSILKQVIIHLVKVIYLWYSNYYFEVRNLFNTIICFNYFGNNLELPFTYIILKLKGS